MTPPPGRSTCPPRGRGATLAGIACLTIAAGALAACGEARPAGPSAPAASLAVVAGDSQRAEVGADVPVAPAVVARDSGGRPVAGVPVLFRVVRGDGTVTDSLTTTDRRGVARVGRWTLGRRVGWQRVVAGASGVDGVVNVDALADPGAPTTLLVANTPPRLALPGGEIFGTVDVRVRDRFGNEVLAPPPRGAPPPRAPDVALAPTVGDSVSIVPDSTGLGLLRLRWRLSTTPGPRTLALRVGGASVTIPAATYVPPFRLAAWAGDRAVKAPGDTVAQVVLYAADSRGDALAGVAVRFHVVSGGGTLRPLYVGYGEVTDAGIVVRTGHDGAARVGPWQLGVQPGPQVLRADVPGVGAFEFTATVIRP